MDDLIRNKSDSELVKMSLGDKDNFLYIVKRYKDKLYNYIRKITDASHEDVEDLLQEVFIKVYQNLNGFDQDLRFSSWIFRIAHNQTISSYRKKKVRPDYRAFRLSDDQAEKITSNYDIQRDIDINILGKKITDTLLKIDKKQREVIVLRFFEEKSYQEISDILQKPTGTVASLLNKSKKEFKKIFNSIYKN